MPKKNKYITKIFKLSLSKQMLIIHFIFALIQAKLLVKFIPLKYYYYKVFSRIEWSQDDLQPFKKHFSLLKKVSNRIPVKLSCLEESIAIHYYFRRFNIKLPIYLGIRKERNDLIFAHAWSAFEEYQVVDFKRIIDHETNKA